MGIESREDLIKKAQEIEDCGGYLYAIKDYSYFGNNKSSFIKDKRYKIINFTTNDFDAGIHFRIMDELGIVQHLDYRWINSNNVGYYTFDTIVEIRKNKLKSLL